jgi:hypothetical protein
MTASHWQFKTVGVLLAAWTLFLLWMAISG